jgi:phosphate:Na+ symporter
LITSLVLLPFSNKIADLTEKIIGRDPEDEENNEFLKLDDRLLQTPVIALEQCRYLTERMIDHIEENYSICTKLLFNYDEEAFQKLQKNESFIDKCDTALSSYIIRINRSELSDDNKFLISQILNSISDLERIGDYCVNIAYDAQEILQEKISFSEQGTEELNLVIQATGESLKQLFDSFKTLDKTKVVCVEPLAETIDQMQNLMKEYHIQRLQVGECSVESGAVFFELANCFERISAHAANVSLHIIKRIEADRNFDEMHGHTQEVSADSYIMMFKEYEEKYLVPLKNDNPVSA